MDAVLTCMVDEKTGPGELNTRFIQTLKEFTGCDGAVAFRSPSLALAYALRAIALEKGSKILVSALAPSWQYRAVVDLGYEVLPLDVSEETGLVTLESVEEGIKDGGRLLLLHETMGILPDLEKIAALGIPLIEDISHSVGAVLPPQESSESNPAAGENQQKVERKAGSFGLYTIMGLEEFDSVTAGGGAVLMAPNRREWIVLKKFTDEAPRTDILPDLNSALAFVQLKEFKRNEEARKTLFNLYQRAVMSGKNKTFVRGLDAASTVWSFPLVLNGAFKEVKSYCSRKEIEIKLAYENSVFSLLSEDEQAKLKVAKKLSLRCVLFPLYPRLGSDSAQKIVKVLGTLP